MNSALDENDRQNEAEEDSGETGGPEKGNLAKKIAQCRRGLGGKWCRPRKEKSSHDAACVALGNVHGKVHWNILDDVHGDANCFLASNSRDTRCPIVLCTSTAIEALPLVVAAYYIHS